jgi:molecular chaperone GrpE
VTPDQIEAVLADFRAWLLEAAPSAETVTNAEPVDLYTLVAQFTALRQEVNLQTRAVRQQQEQNAETLRQLEAAVNRPAMGTSSDEQVRPLLNALIDVADTQQRAAAEMSRAAEAMKKVLDTNTKQSEQPRPKFRRRSIIARALGYGRQERFEERLIERMVEKSTRRRPELEQLYRQTEAAAVGLAIGVERIERAMTKLGLQPIGAVGQPFDPELMEAVEVAVDSGLPAGEVVDELRRGYRWNGRVFRFAQVRVAK